MGKRGRKRRRQRGRNEVTKVGYWSEEWQKYEHFANNFVRGPKEPSISHAV